MHYPIVCYVQGQILKIEGALLLVPALTGLLYREQAAAAYLLIAVICEAIGLLLTLRRPKKFVLYAREGMVSVALAWIVLSLFGALPFVLCGDIPSFSNALFEIISGFTTTGASILEDVEVLSHASLIWRSFSHWVGGMGVIVFMLAIIPMASGYNMQLMKAESPGPSVGKLVPRVKESAKILYLIYVSLTGIQLVLLLLTGMKGFDAVCITFGTAGTGGFGVKNDSLVSYSPYLRGLYNAAAGDHYDLHAGVRRELQCVLLSSREGQEAGLPDGGGARLFPDCRGEHSADYDQHPGAVPLSAGELPSCSLSGCIDYHNNGVQY